MINNIRKKLLAYKSQLDYEASLLRYSKKLPQLSIGDRWIVDTLKKEGAYITTLADLGLPSTRELLQASHRLSLEMKQVSNSHLTYKFPQIYTVTSLPEFSTWGSNKRLLNIIENYIGLPITFHGVHLRKDFSNQHQLGTLLWHKDSEDRRMIKVIIYLHDVEEHHGPFEYVPRSLTSLPNFNGYRVDRKLQQLGYLGLKDEELAKILPKSACKSCVGSAGTVIIADTRAILHHGTIRTEERSALFFTYTANSPKRPDLCRQYWDNTFTIPVLSNTSVHS
jgi:hypothetical protein